MQYQLKIKNLDYLKPSFAGFGAILVEKNPDVEFTKPRHTRPIESYLWYPIELGPIPTTFTSYFREKLAVTDPVEAQQIITDWNTKQISPVTPMRKFKIDDKRFLVLEGVPGIDGQIVITNYMDRPKHRTFIYAGSGGYLWNYLASGKLPNTPATHDMLLVGMGLKYKRERDQFIKKWY